MLRRGDLFDHLIDYIHRYLCDDHLTFLVQLADFPYRNRKMILESTLRRYSRLCNILLKQGRVSSKLRAKTIDLLGSASDKEEFSKEFELFDDLLSLYLSKRRYRDYFDLCALTGDLPSVLNVAISDDLDDVLDKRVLQLLLTMLWQRLSFRAEV